MILINHNKLITFVLTISLLAFSFSNFVATALFISLITILSISLYKITSLNKVNRTPLLIGVFFFIIFNSFILLSATQDDFYINNYIKFIAIQVYFFIFLICLKTEVITEHKLENALKYFIYIQVLFFIIQLVAYILFDFYINFDEFIRQEDSYALYQTKALADTLIPIRATGLYSEPSFYAMVVLIPAAYFLMKNKVNLAVILAIITSLLSLSIASMAVTLLMLVIFFLSNKSYLKIKFMFLLTVIILLPTLYSVFELRVLESVDYDVINSRLLIFKELKQRSEFYDIIGSGFFWGDLNPIGKLGLMGYHIRDSSIYIYIYYCAGIIGIIIFTSLMLYILSINKKGFLYLICLFLFKYQILFGFIWLAIYLIGFRVNNQRSK